MTICVPTPGVRPGLMFPVGAAPAVGRVAPGHSSDLTLRVVTARSPELPQRGDDGQADIVEPVTRNARLPALLQPRSAYGLAPPRQPLSGLLAVTLLFGCLAWWIVAQRTLARRTATGRSVAFPAAMVANAIGALLVLLIGGGILASSGLPGRFPPESLVVAQYLNYDRTQPYREGSCFLGESEQFSNFDRRTCLDLVSGKPNVLIFGDSQAAQLWYGMNLSFPEIHFLQATASACPLMVEQPGGTRAGCRDLSDYMHREYLDHTHVDAVILSGRWRAGHIPSLDRQIAWMKKRGIPVVLVGPGMEYDLPLPRLLGMALRDQNPELLARHWDAEARATDDELKALARDTWKIPYISIFDDLCTPRCATYAAPGVPIFFDGHHFTAEGSLLFARAVRARDQMPDMRTP